MATKKSTRSSSRPTPTLVAPPQDKRATSNLVSHSVSRVLDEHQSELYSAHGFIDCALSKVREVLEEGDDVGSIECVLRKAMRVIYRTAGLTEEIAIKIAANALDAERDAGGAA